MEQFYTIQGEGAFTGTPAYFVRLGGCDVGCFWCDVKESWDADVHPKIAVEELVQNVVESGSKIVIVTGGEPCMHNLEELTVRLKEAGVRTHIETSGTHPLTGTWDWITFSPKKFKEPLDEFYKVSHELKVIVYNKHDIEWGEGHGDRMHADAQLYFQPEWDVRDNSIPIILNHIRENAQWRISLQTHKYIGVQ